MLHEWNPHILPDLMQCRHCKCIRYKADLVKESRNVYDNIDSGESKLLTNDFFYDLKYYREKKYPCLYVYSNYSYYIIKDGVLKAAWTLIHPTCTNERNAQAIQANPREYQEDIPEPYDDADEEEGGENSL